MPTAPDELVSGIVLCVFIIIGVGVVIVEGSPDDADGRAAG
jgi:hypothetical protein